MPPFEETVLPAPCGDSLEIDEMWTFVQSKKTPHWLWLAVSFQTRQVVSFALGHRDLATARQLWDNIPRSYWKKHVYTDQYCVYPQLVGTWQHHACLKGSGRTNTVERANCTLRQRVSPLVRKTLSFAKNAERLEERITWFLHCYNRQWERRIVRMRNDKNSNLT